MSSVLLTKVFCGSVKIVIHVRSLGKVERESAHYLYAFTIRQAASEDQGSQSANKYTSPYLAAVG